MDESGEQFQIHYKEPGGPAYKADPFHGTREDEARDIAKLALERDNVHRHGTLVVVIDATEVPFIFQVRNATATLSYENEVNHGI